MIAKSRARSIMRCIGIISFRCFDSTFYLELRKTATKRFKQIAGDLSKWFARGQSPFGFDCWMGDFIAMDWAAWPMGT